MSSAAWMATAPASCAIVAATTPMVRRLAVAKGIVDQPGGHKSHHTPVPYLGGLAIMLGAVAAHVAIVGLVGRTAVILLAAVMLGLVGAVDDRRNLHPVPRLAAQAAAAVAAVGVGVRANITGHAVIDSVATVVWIVVMTNALNFVDNMDGLAAGVAAASAVSAFVLASAAEQRIVATAASALVGACLGFLAYNRRPASIYMGDAGSLFLGYLLAVVVVQVDPVQSQPRSWMVPLLLLGIPVLDTATVMVARWHNDRKLYLGGRDHLSHRLVARGWSPADAVLTLVGCQGLLGGLAVLVGRGLLPLWLGLAAGTAVVVALLHLALSAEVYTPVRPSRAELTPSESFVTGLEIPSAADPHGMASGESEAHREHRYDRIDPQQRAR